MSIGSVLRSWPLGVPAECESGDRGGFRSVKERAAAAVGSFER
ncbi:hypothetical protein CASFOL_031366 [Castilleja foliolosa]|uniref:Uncharacterized protein n=1 Tax=Castilleja foliolosa TaxID=1961234 RepID=A0ABD3C4H8_9LAMI